MGPDPQITENPAKNKNKSLPKRQKSCAIEIELGTLTNVPASPAFIRALQVERLLNTRPNIASLADVKTSSNPPDPLLDFVVKNAPFISRATRLPDGFSIVPLDYGRITLSDASRFFSWTAGTQLSCSFADDHIQIMAAHSDAQEIDASGRLLIPSTLRHRLGITSKEQVLVVTDTQPTPHALIYSLKTLYNSLTNR